MEMDLELTDLDLLLDPVTMRWYVRLLCLRHASIVVGLSSASLLMLPFGRVDEIAGNTMQVSLLVFALTVTILVWPLCVRTLRGRPVSYTRFHYSLNVLNGNSLLDDSSSPNPTQVNAIVRLEYVLFAVLVFSSVIFIITEG
jgi:hypothetical protein